MNLVEEKTHHNKSFLEKVSESQLVSLFMDNTTRVGLDLFQHELSKQAKMYN